MNKKISIIIPAYKVDAYIEKCIRSLENQDLLQDEYEIIVTNDGSPDQCREIVEALQQQFSNIVLINQENQGVSMARNNAIAIAKGEYILPIDPDDYVLPCTLKNIIDIAEKHRLDVLYLGFEIFDVNGKSVWLTDYSKQKDTIYNGVEGYFASRGFHIRDPDRSWAMLYRSDMLKQFNITYPRDVPYLEDGLFLTKVFSLANKVMFDNSIFYQRTTRIGSATNSRLFYSDHAIQGFIKAIQNIQEFENVNHLSIEQKKLINHTVAKFVILALTPSILTFNFKQYFKVIALFKKVGLEKLNTDGLRFLYKKHIKMYNASKYFFPVYFRLNNK